MSCQTQPVIEQEHVMGALTAGEGIDVRIRVRTGPIWDRLLNIHPIALKSKDLDEIVNKVHKVQVVIAL